MKNNLIILFLCLSILSSCGIFTQVHSQNRDLTLQVENKALFDSLENSYLSYKTLKIRFSATYTSRVQTLNLGGTLKIKKDTFIWLSLSPGFGIEAARVLLTPDSVKFINRLKKEYFTGSYDFLTQKYGLQLDFNTAQSILTNELFIYPAVGKKVDLNNDFSLSDDSVFQIFTNSLSDTLWHKVFVRKSDYKIKKTHASMEKQKKTFDLNYTNFNTFNGKLFPTSIKLNANVPTMDREFDISYDKIYVNKAVSASFRISDKYTKINLLK